MARFESGATDRKAGGAQGRCHGDADGGGPAGYSKRICILRQDGAAWLVELSVLAIRTEPASWQSAEAATEMSPSSAARPCAPDEVVVGDPDLIAELSRRLSPRMPPDAARRRPPPVRDILASARRRWGHGAAAQADEEAGEWRTR